MAAFNPIRIVLVAWVTVLMFSFSSQGWAQGQALIVRNVEIDATASTAFEAQSQAMTAGQLRAAEILIARLTLAEDRLEQGVPPLTADGAAGLIAGLQIADEQRSSTRYRGVLTVAFDRREVRNYFNALGLPYVESQAAPILVVPVLEGANGDAIWGTSWLRAWQEGGFDTALTPALVVGTREGSGGRDPISVREARNLDEGALRALAGLYGVDTVAVILAREGGGAVRAVGVTIEFTAEGSTRTNIPSAAHRGYADAAARIVERREEVWKRASVVRDGGSAELAVTLIFSSIDEWRDLQNAVAGASLIENARLDALSRTGAAMTITHRGTRAQVMSELGARGARLEEEDALGWTVRSR